MDSSYDLTVKRLSFGDKSIHSKGLMTSLLDSWPLIDTCSNQHQPQDGVPSTACSHGDLKRYFSSLCMNLTEVVRAFNDSEHGASSDVLTEEYIDAKKRQGEEIFRNCKSEIIDHWTKDGFISILQEEGDALCGSTDSVRLSDSTGTGTESHSSTGTVVPSFSSRASWDNDAGQLNISAMENWRKATKEEAVAAKAVLRRVRASYSPQIEELRAVIDEIESDRQARKRLLSSIMDDLREFEDKVTMQDTTRQGHFSSSEHSEEIPDYNDDELEAIEKQVQELGKKTEESDAEAARAFKDVASKERAIARRKEDAKVNLYCLKWIHAYGGICNKHRALQIKERLQEDEHRTQ